MARPDNSHHVHSDGYMSEMGDVDEERMMEEMADEIEQEAGVTDVWPDTDVDGPYVEVEHDGDQTSIQRVEQVARDWGCRVTETGTEWLVVRPD